MPTKNLMPLRRDSNENIADAIRSSSSLDYQNRIPSATKAGIQETLKALTEYRPAWNEFVNTLVNRIGGVEVRNITWSNPLAEFKRGMLNYGDTIEEINVGLLKSYIYDPDRDYMERAIFSTETPDIQANFHSVNRREFYKITVNEAMLKRAFLEDGGISKFVAAMLAAPTTSDNWDEYLLTTSLFAEYEKNGGFYHVNVPDVNALSSDGADARLTLRKLRGMAGTLSFPSSKYNAAGVPSFANPEDLLIFASPEFSAAIDVEALAAAFNIDKADMHGRVITVPQERFGIDGCQAILTTKDFFVIADSLIENTSQFNPVTLATNYFFHHHSVISASRFVPAVMFWTGPGDTETVVIPSVTSVGVPTFKTVDDVTVTGGDRGNIFQAESVVVTSPADAPVGAVSWSVSGNTSPRTYITDTGVLHVGGGENAATITVKASSVYTSPEGVRADPKTNTATFTVTGPRIPEWPVDAEIYSITVKGVAVPSVSPETLTYSLAVPDGTADVSDVVVSVERAGVATVTVNGAKTQVTIKVADGTADSPRTYLVNLTAA